MGVCLGMGKLLSVVLFFFPFRCFCRWLFVLVAAFRHSLYVTPASLLRRVMKSRCSESSAADRNSQVSAPRPHVG